SIIILFLCTDTSPTDIYTLSLHDALPIFPEPDGLKDFYTATDDHVQVQLSSLIPGSQIFYTVDGSTPTDQSPRYQTPFQVPLPPDRKSTRLNSSHRTISYAVFCLKKKNNT